MDSSSTSYTKHSETGATPTLYFVDGYHGGIKGHMAPGSWRDIFSVMRRSPEWKICIDIEPISWTHLRRRDPESYRELVRYMEDTSVEARAEMVAASYAQPYGWVIGGESNIRHLTRGLEILREHFPQLLVDTYAVQEPCWTSALPQILKSLGYKRAVLKDPSTAWAGYTTGFDADVVNWVGPDGTAIACVPRYACEELLNCWETEGAHATAEFARKCVEHGITKPAGMYFQDCGWPAKPRVQGDHIQYATWREYVEKIAPKAEKEWHFTQEDIRCVLPWGEGTLRTLARQVRAAENKLVQTEKLAALAVALGGLEWPAAKLREAWDQALLAEHHDAWICARAGGGRRQWAWQVSAETWVAEDICDEILAASAETFAQGTPGEFEPESRVVRVFNSLGTEREDVVDMLVTAPRGTRFARVLDGEGREVPAQIFPTRKYQTDETFNAGRLLFRAKTPGVGYSTYRLETVSDPTATAGKGVEAVTQEDGMVRIESDLYRIVLDPVRGGVVRSLYVKELDREFVDAGAERLFSEYRGYFIEEKAWHSSAEGPAKVTIVENGPVRAKVLFQGQIGEHPFHSTIAVSQGQRRIDFQAMFVFANETWIGDPCVIDPAERRSQRRRSHHNDSWKLQAFFPSALAGRQNLYKNAAFDVCKSQNKDTFFDSWDEIKSNIILNWVDVTDEAEAHGLALLSDHTTIYAHGTDYPLSLILSWGGDGGFWWGKCAQKGPQEAAYSLVPHAGRWDAAGISQECARWSEPLVGKVVDGEPGAEMPLSRSLVQVAGEGYEVPTVLADGKDLLVRLFNAEGDDAPRRVSVGVKPAKACLTELDGRFIEEIPVKEGADGRWSVEIAMPRFGLRTVRFCGVCNG